MILQRPRAPRIVARAVTILLDDGDVPYLLLDGTDGSGREAGYTHHRTDDLHTVSLSGRIVADDTHAATLRRIAYGLLAQADQIEARP